MAECQETEDLSESEGVTDQTKLCKPEGSASPKKGRLQKVGQRFRDPFNKKRLKKSRQREKALEATVEGLLTKFVEIICLNPRGQDLLESVDTLQINFTKNQDSESGLAGIQGKVDKLTNAANQLIEDLTKENEKRAKNILEIKMNLERSEIKLEEIKDMMIQCTSKVTEEERDKSQALKDLEDLKEAMLANLPDEKVVSDGITVIRQGYIFRHEYDHLPFQTKFLVTRLVHLFGHKGLVALCKELKVEMTEEINRQGFHKEGTSEGELLLNKDLCAQILITWVNKPLDNHKNTLMEVIQTRERERQRQIEKQLGEISFTSEERSVHSDDQDDTLYQPLSRFWEQESNTTDGGSSLSFHENYYDYSSLEREMLHLVKILPYEEMIP